MYVQVPQGEVIFEEKWALGQLSQIVFGPQFQTFTCDAGCYNLASDIFWVTFNKNLFCARGEGLLNLKKKYFGQIFTFKFPIFCSLFFEVKGRCLRIPVIKKNKTTSGRRGQTYRFLGIKLIQLYLISSNVPVFENRKKCCIFYYSTLQYCKTVKISPSPPLCTLIYLMTQNFFTDIYNSYLFQTFTGIHISSVYFLFLTHKMCKMLPVQ